MDLWAACLERRRDGGRATLPELDRLQTKDAKQEHPTSSDYRGDGRLPNPNEPSGSSLGRYGPSGMWSVPYGDSANI